MKTIRALVAACLVACGSPEAAPDERVVLEGRILAYVEDHADGSSRTGYAIATADGEHVELAANPAIAARVGAWVALEGHDVLS